jgi:N utilization substance protein A
LAPAEISRVIIDEENRSMEVIVPDEFLSVAIGKRGQNVRLASKLTGWHLDVRSEELYNQDMQAGYESLLSLPDVSDSLADALVEKGFYSVEEISRAVVEDLLAVRGMSEEEAARLIAASRDAVSRAAEAAAEAKAQAAAAISEDAGQAADAADPESATGANPAQTQPEPAAAPVEEGAATAEEAEKTKD